MMKISVFYDHILQAHEQSGKSVPEILHLCRSFGIDGVEMEYSLFAKNRESICGMLSEAGITVSSFYDFFAFHKNAGLSKAKEMLETASQLQAAHVLVVSGELSWQEAAELSASSSSYDDVSGFMDNHSGIQNIKQALTSLTAYAQKLDVTVTLEDFDGFVQPFARMNQLLWFMNHVPGLRYTLDMGNFAFSDEDVSEAADLLKASIVHVHCKDRAFNPAVNGKACKGLGPCPVGSGYIPVQALVSSLKEWGYEGYLAIEHFGAPDQLSYIRESAAFLKKCIKENHCQKL